MACLNPHPNAGVTMPHGLHPIPQSSSTDPNPLSTGVSSCFLWNRYNPHGPQDLDFTLLPEGNSLPGAGCVLVNGAQAMAVSGFAILLHRHQLSGLLGTDSVSLEKRTVVFPVPRPSQGGDEFMDSATGVRQGSHGGRNHPSSPWEAQMEQDNQGTQKEMPP